eukprot:Plantae.Rhodophyta-Purpureofilum_apyrenoidigerum.ctg23870.p1 GENE.Plantae.Rhodophyta-Purpureofilum_apyrenoidigerum.ctg23870~~Plantae.Rhodophyta-Purpureofilum_apyrenoidigerum.ctg23870.p1  ORF type:complete len:439 (-),score=77.18 Plantae.Rhodophyta-Purpureofilum_apyrenoidigerum.ctg23870:44-1291(-)
MEDDRLMESNGASLVDEEDDYLNEEECEVIELKEGDGVDDSNEMDEAGDEDADGINEVVDEDVEVEVDDTYADLEGHTDSVYCVVASPTDNNVIATGGGDDRALVHDVRNSTLSGKFEGLGDSVACAAFSSDGKRVAFGVMSGRIIVVEVGTDRIMYEPSGPTMGVEWLQFHPRGPFLLAGSEDTMVYMFNDKGEYVMGFAGHHKTVMCGGFTPSGTKVVSGSEDGTLKTWNPRDGTCTGTTAPVRAEEEPPAVISLDMSDKGGSSTLAVAGYSDGSVKMFNLDTMACVGEIPSHEDSVECVAFSPSHVIPRMCASAGMDGIIRIWDMEQSRVRCEFQHGDGVVGMKWHPNKQGLFISTGRDRTVRVWDAKKGLDVAVLQGNRNTILSMDVGVTGEYVVTGGDDHHVRLFNLYQQ